MVEVYNIADTTKGSCMKFRKQQLVMALQNTNKIIQLKIETFLDVLFVFFSNICSNNFFLYFFYFIVIQIDENYHIYNFLKNNLS